MKLAEMKQGDWDSLVERNRQTRMLIEQAARMAQIAGFDHGYREGRSQGRWEGIYIGVALMCVIVLVVVGFSR